MEGRYGREGDLKNVVLNYESRDGSYSKYVVSYNITEDDLFKWERGSGSINFPESTTFFNVGTSENPNGFTLNDPDCWETIVVGQVAIPCASGMHQPGMTGCIYEGTSQAAVVQDVTIQVISVGCGSNAGIGGTPGNGSGPGSGGTNPGNGNNNGNNNGGNNNPGDDNPGHNNPGFSDQDGDPIITKPVKTLEPEEEEDKNCEDLKNRSSNSQFLDKMNELKTDAAQSSVETGMAMYKTSPNYSSKESGGIDSEGNPYLSLTFNPSGGVIGFMHCHLDATYVKSYAVFSLSDFVALGIMVENSNANTSEFVMYVTSNKGTFAVKLTNKQSIIDLKDYIVNNPEEADKRFKQYVKYTQSTNKQIKGLLQFLNEKSTNEIKLYQSDNQFGNWKEKYIENNDVKSKDC